MIKLQQKGESPDACKHEKSLRFVAKAFRKLEVKSEADNELKALCCESRKTVSL